MHAPICPLPTPAWRTCHAKRIAVSAVRRSLACCIRNYQASSIIAKRTSTRWGDEPGSPGQRACQRHQAPAALAPGHQGHGLGHPSPAVFDPSPSRCTDLLDDGWAVVAEVFDTGYDACVRVGDT